MTDKIDWTKPVRMVRDRSVELAVVARPAKYALGDTGNRLVKWQYNGGDCYAIVTEHGNLIATLHAGIPHALAQPFVENVPEDPHALLKCAIKYVRQTGQNMLPPHKLGCEGVADMYETVCKAAEQVLWDNQAKKEPSHVLKSARIMR